MSFRTNSQATVKKKRLVLLTKDMVHYNPIEKHDVHVQIRKPSASQLTGKTAHCGKSRRAGC